MSDKIYLPMQRIGEHDIAEPAKSFLGSLFDNWFVHSVCVIGSCAKSTIDGIDGTLRSGIHRHVLYTIGHDGW